ncbi:MAG: tRNA threonylcarbamoyladenosine biosynthesis protein TsaE [Planctomycetota bacterium]
MDCCFRPVQIQARASALGVLIGIEEDGVMASVEDGSKGAREYVSRDTEQTEGLGERLGRWLPAGSVLALEGELGAGKTCLVRGLARGLGIRESIQSPTYQLMQATESGRLPLYHFDAWMDGREIDFLEDGGGEWFDAGGVAAVEWAERVERWLPETRIEIRLAHVDSETRRIELRVVGDQSGAMGTQLRGVLEALPASLAAPERAPEAPDAGSQTTPDAKAKFRPIRDCGQGLPKRPTPDASKSD